MYLRFPGKLYFAIVTFRPQPLSANRVRVTLIIRSLTFERVLVRLTGRKFFGSTRWPPLCIGDTLAVSQSFGSRPESSEVWKIFERV